MSIYDRFKNQPLMRMQDGGTPTDAENTETVDVEVVGIPKYPYGHPSEAVENLHDRRRDINESIKKGYYRGEFLDDNPKTFKALLNELKMIDKELQMTQGMGGNTRRMNEANQSMADTLKNLRGYADGGSPLTREQAAEILNMSKEGIPMFSGDGSFTTPSIDLGGGLGAIPGVTLNYNDILAGLKDQMFGIPTVFTDPVEEEIEDEIKTTAPVMPVAPVKDPVVEVVSEEVAEEVVPSPTPAPAPAPAPAPPVVDTSGIGSLPQVVLPPTPAEDMNLITGTDAGLTDEEISSVANPTLTPTTGADLARLNQQYNDTFLRFLAQDPADAQATAQANEPVYSATSPQGTQSGLQAGEYISRFAQPNIQQPIDYGYGASNNYTMPANVQFQMDNVFADNRNRDYLRNRSIQNLDPSIRNSQLYGDLLFPVFGSGVTSLVPQQAVNELFKR